MSLSLNTIHLLNSFSYWPHSALSLDPRLHAKWIATISFIGRVVSLPIPPVSTFFLNAPQDPSSSSSAPTPRPTPPPLLSIVEAVLPAPLTKQHLTKGLQHPNGLVQHLTALALARGLQKLTEVQEMFKEIEGELEADGPWARRRREVELECRRRVPEVSVIIGFAQRSGTGQSNGPDADETQAAARTALLTESALRLFGLYHKALPSLAAEVRFDVGKLLVSASSAGALAAERRAAREGSVISDTGSVASVGTLGSVGMGGGFGHTRGDVEGFEALSQVHVLRLLQDVTEWNWANKAGESSRAIYDDADVFKLDRRTATCTTSYSCTCRLRTPSQSRPPHLSSRPCWSHPFSMNMIHRSSRSG